MHLEKKLIPPMLVWALAFASTAIYVFERGYPQPGHILMLAFAIAVSLSLKLQPFDLPEKLLLTFVCYVLLINTYFYVDQGGVDFLIASAYWVYNAIIFLSLRRLFIFNPRVAEALPYGFLFVISLTIFLILFGGDRFFWDTRFIGTFNDPNQLSYWLLCALVGTILCKNRPSWFSPSIGLIAVILVFVIAVVAGSRSAVIATWVLLLATLWWAVACALPKGNFRAGIGRKGGYFCVAALLIVAIAALTYQLNAGVTVAVDDFVTRVLDRDEDYAEQLYIRGYTRLYEFPQYLIFGSGEGQNGRFTPGLFEIHSSFAAPLFYYGIFGFALIYAFFYTLIQGRLRGWQVLAISAPFVYGLFTYGLRTPIFWIMLAVVCAQLRSISGSEKSNDHR